MPNAKFVGNPARNAAIQRKLLAAVGYIVTPVEMQEKPPFDVGQQMVDAPGFLSSNAVFASD